MPDLQPPSAPADSERSSASLLREYSLTATDKLCFIHILKTAGSTLTSILDAHFDVSEICPELAYLNELVSKDAPIDDRTNVAQVLEHYRLVRGHILFHKASRFLPANTLYVTMLREPIDRVVSTYEFCRRIRENDVRVSKADLKFFSKATADGLLAFVRNPDPRIQRLISNRQFYQLTPRLLTYPVDSSSEWSEDGNGDYLDASLLQVAKDNLKNFAVVGLKERFQDSVFLLSYCFGWLPIVTYQNLRVAAHSSDQPELDAETIAAIQAINPLDIELYNYAQALFADRFTEMVSVLRQRYGVSDRLDLTQVANLQAVLETHYEHRYRAEPNGAVSRLDFDFRQPMSGYGWQRRNGRFNGLKSKGTTFRWTGPSTVSTLDFPLQADADLTLRIRIVNAGAPDILQSFQLEANGHPIRLKTIYRRGNFFGKQGILPRAVLANGKAFTRLTFKVNRTVTLDTVNTAGSDSRLVGLAIDRLQIFPTAAPPAPDTRVIDFLLSRGNFPFPDGDRLWVGVDRFMTQHLKPGEKVAAPSEFSDRFPAQFCPYTTAFWPQTDLHWVILHKGYLEEVESASLWQTVRQFKMVYANEVMVIYTDRPEVPAVNPLSKDARSFWRSWLLMKLQRTLRRI